MGVMRGPIYRGKEPKISHANEILSPDEFDAASVRI
jgi:hypothetical protein